MQVILVSWVIVLAALIAFELRTHRLRAFFQYGIDFDNCFMLHNDFAVGVMHEVLEDEESGEYKVRQLRFYPEHRVSDWMPYAELDKFAGVLVLEQIDRNRARALWARQELPQQPAAATAEAELRLA